MMTYQELKSSNDIEIENCLDLDNIAKEIMKQLNLKAFRSLKNRQADIKKAKQLWKNEIDLKKFAIHHTMSGLVVLLPRKLHRQVHHKGYFYRLNY